MCYETPVYLAVLTELAFVSNAGDAHLLRTRQDQMARALYEAILSYYQ